MYPLCTISHFATKEEACFLASKECERLVEAVLSPAFHSPIRFSSYFQFFCVIIAGNITSTILLLDL